MRAVRHEHAVELSISPEITEKYDQVRDHLEENKKPYLFGIGGIIIGAVGMRIFTRKSAVVQVVVQQAPAAE